MIECIILEETEGVLPYKGLSFYKCLLTLNGFEAMFYTEYERGLTTKQDLVKRRDREVEWLAKRVQKLQNRIRRKKGLIVKLDPTHSIFN